MGERARAFLEAGGADLGGGSCARVAASTVLFGLSLSLPAAGQASTPAQANASSSASASDVAQGADLTVPPGVSTHHYQTIAAAALVLTSGTVWYIADRRNVFDWDRPSLKSRLTGESWRYDNNTFWMNFFGHPFFGSSVYAVARDSHGGVLYGFLASFLTSMSWEFGIEYNERVSVNDVIFTPLTGVAVGEFSHKLGYYLASYSGRNLGRAALAWTLTPFTQASHFSCSGETRREHPTDALGYSSGLWHDFYLDYGISNYRATGTPDGALQQLRAGGTLVALPNYRSPGRSSRGFFNAELSRLSLTFERGAKGAGITLMTDSTLFGYASRSLTNDGAGHSHALGLAVGYGYHNSHAAGLDERLSWLGFPGAAADLYWSNGKLSSEWVLRAYPVFGGASSPAFRVYRSRQTGTETYKTVLNREGYFYGFGLVSELQARQHFGIFHNQLEFTAASLWSSQGLDREQAKVTDDTQARDWLAGLELRAWVDLSRSFVAGLEAKSQLRASRAGDVRLTLERRDLGLWLGARF